MISCFSKALIGAFQSLLFHSVICSLGGPLSHSSPVVVFIFNMGIHASGISIPLSLLVLSGRSCNSAHFVSTISNGTIPDNKIMVSFDIESLFTKIPIDTAVQAAPQKLENNPSLAERTMLTPAQIADLLTFILRSTCFQYNRSIYEQKDGAARGVWFPLLLLTST